MLFLLKASIAIACLLIFYKLLLEKESFFKANRVYLLSCLAIAFIIPSIAIPKVIDRQGIVEEVLATPNNNLSDEIDITTELDSNINSREDQATLDPSIANSTNPSNEKELYQSNNSRITPIEMEKTRKIQNSTTKGLVYWMFWIYVFGVIILSLNLIGQVLSILFKIMRNKDQIKDEGYIIINLEEESEPCSFFNYIFINPASYDYDTYEQILAHEKQHVDRKHTWDLLLSELAVIVFWFNPFIWLLRKEVEKNLEYQTDHALIDDAQDQKEEYQLNLVRIACKTFPLAITTNYNQSLIKQRILKMNSKKSNSFNYWKYTFSLPLVFVLILILNKPIGLLGSNLDNTPTTFVESPKEVFNEMESEAPISDLDPIIPMNTKEQLKPKKMTSAMIADCEEFEKAVAAGDLIKVKEILKTLDPDCLKLKKNEKSNLNSVQDLVKEKKNEIKERQTTTSSTQTTTTTTTDEKHELTSVCQSIKDAVDDRNSKGLREILINEDFSCLNDIYGDPTRHVDLIKNLLAYGADLSIDRYGIVSISDIGFLINIEDPSADGCTDPNYLRLVSAIKNYDETEIRSILTLEDLTCPLNSDGVRNDFIFIKKLMKYKPEIINRNGREIKVFGIGVQIDLDMKVDKPEDMKLTYDDDPVAYYRQAEVLEQIESSLDKKNRDIKQSSCDELIYFILTNDYLRSKTLLKSLDPNCFHKETYTETGDDYSNSVSIVLTPLIAAASEGNLAIVKEILKSNADVNYMGGGKTSALITAAQAGALEVVKILVEHGASINLKDEEGKTALDYATEDKNNSIINFLKRKGAK